MAKKLTESKFESTKSFRLKTLVALLNSTYIRVTKAVRELKTAGAISPKIVKPGTVGRPFIELSKNEAKKVAKHLEAEFSFAKERKVTVADQIEVPAPVEAPVEAPAPELTTAE